MFVAGDAPLAVLKALAGSKPSVKVTIHYYTSISQIWETVSDFTSGRHYLTIYLEFVPSHIPLNLLTLLEHTTTNPNVKALAGITILLDDRKGLGQMGP